MKLFLADIRSLAPYETRCLPLLTPGRREAISQIVRPEDRLHSCGAGLLLRHVLNVREDGDLRFNEYGKGELTHSPQHFNLSHGGSYAVLAVWDRPVGVDIEPIGDRIPVPLSSRFFRPDERAWLEQDPTPRRFARLWTRLESALKADGRGFGLDGRDFSVLDRGEPWYIETWEHDGHVISCAGARPFETHVTLLSAEKLLR